MSLTYALCLLDVRESLAVQFFVDAIIDKDKQFFTRLMVLTDLKSAMTYSMRYEATKTASKISRQARSGAPQGNEDAFFRRPCIKSCERDLNAGRKFGVEANISVRALTMSTEDTWSLSEIQKAQLEDTGIRTILEKKLKSANRPSRQEIAEESSVTKRYRVLWDSLHLKYGLLYRERESNDGSSCRWRRCFLIKLRECPEKSTLDDRVIRLSSRMKL
ncbi:hypothetical protein AVEN_184086-1 [Araneus ventricosus]|uniref:Uncharacterized protein n=1 Tax=Araneus ventricosus TaxID=182803 RepID=A0A4Y2CZ45_ARAVE|nr:hypothetical protein AVEN_184086-1 [Araneus ventricosus]